MHPHCARTVHFSAVFKAASLEGLDALRRHLADRTHRELERQIRDELEDKMARMSEAERRALNLRRELEVRVGPASDD